LSFSFPELITVIGARLDAVAPDSFREETALTIMLGKLVRLLLLMSSFPEPVGVMVPRTIEAAAFNFVLATLLGLIAASVMLLVPVMGLGPAASDGSRMMNTRADAPEGTTATALGVSESARKGYEAVCYFRDLARSLGATPSQLLERE